MSQSFLVREVFQSPWHLCSPLLYPLQQVPVLVELGSPELNTVLQLWPHQGTVRGGREPPSNLPATLFSAPRMTLAFLATKAHGHPIVHQDSQVLFLVPLQLEENNLILILPESDEVLPRTSARQIAPGSILLA